MQPDLERDNNVTKILFVMPPYITFDDYINPAMNVKQIKKPDGKYYRRIPSDMPLGIFSLSGYVKKYSRTKIETLLVDFNVELNQLRHFNFASFADFYGQILAGASKDFNPDIIGVSVLFSSAFYNMLDLAASIRNVFPDTLLVAGGSVPATMYREIFRASDAFDALCYGEGEKPLLNLIDAPDRYQHLKEGSSWVTQEKVQSNMTFVHDFIENLDEIPFPDYGMCDMAKYGEDPPFTALSGVKGKTNNFSVMTSRGCPFKCTFCASHKVHGRDMRYYSLKRVKEDLLSLRDEYGAKIIAFLDDNFMGGKRRPLEIVRFIETLGVEVVFQSGLAIFALDREFLEAMKRCGVNHIFLPMESGSERVLKEVMRKPLKLSIVNRVVDDCKDLGFYTNANILIGSPNETKKDIEDTRQFLKTLDINWFMFVCASPLVGSEMYDVCRDKDYLKEDVVIGYQTAVIETEDFSAAYIQEMTYRLNLEFNFVGNNDYKHGRYETAIIGFENVIKNTNDHAFAYYYASKCYEKIGDSAKANE